MNLFKHHESKSYGEEKVEKKRKENKLYSKGK